MLVRQVILIRNIDVNLLFHQKGKVLEGVGRYFKVFRSKNKEKRTMEVEFHDSSENANKLFH